MARLPRYRRSMACLLAVSLLHAVAPLASAQGSQSVTEVITFLLTNRSIPTGDFVRDERAATDASDVLARFLTLDLATVPVSSSSGGFTYRFDPALGTAVRSSDSFGPFFTERSLTAGRHQGSLAIGYRSTRFEAVDGRDLRDGTLVSTASVIRGESTPFDIETVSLRIRTDTTTLTGNVGLTDRLDIGAALPIVRVRLEGQRVDTYRGRPLVQAVGSATASGLGDVVLRAKYNVLRRGASGVSLAGEARLPTGDEDNLFGTGRTTLTPRLIGSFDGARLGLHGEASYAFRSRSKGLGYGAAVTVVAAPRLTLIGEVSGLRLDDAGRLTEAKEPHPTLLGVDTIRLSTLAITTNRLVAVGGLKWNVASTWLLTANVRHALTDVGLDAGWVPAVTLDYSFGR